MLEGALSGLKVVELSERVAGPFCTKVMADLGAEVIKLEKPGTGDVACTHGPFPGDDPQLEKSARFFYLNTNKLGVTLNLSAPAGRELFRQLVKDADVSPAPRLGEHNGQIYGERLGLSLEQIEQLHKQGVI